MNSLNLICYKYNFSQGITLLSDNDSLLETDFFCVEFLSEVSLPIKSTVVLITDFPFEVEGKPFNGVYKYNLTEDSLKRYFREEGFDFKDYSIDIEGKKYSKLFLNYPIGLSEIHVYDNENEILIHEFKVNVTSEKLNEGEFVSIINYIESKAISLWSKYSLLRNPALPNEEINKNDWQLLFIELFLEDFGERHLQLFQFDKIKFLDRESEVVSYSSEVLVDEQSAIWLMENFDVLIPTHSRDSEKMLIRNRLFHPIEVLTTSTYESTDLPENRVVHGFVAELMRFLNAQKDELMRQLQLFSTQKSFQEILFFYSQKRRVKLINNYLVRLGYIKQKLIEFIPVSITSLEYIPTNRIESKEHYLYAYRKFVEWFSFDQIRHSNNKIHFKGVTRMDKLFERACLFKLIDLFSSLGYQFDVIAKRDSIPQQIRFSHEETTRIHQLYYEILPDNMVTTTTGGKLKPDFYIEFDNGKSLILDAKYKRDSSVQKFDWEKMCFKYLHGIGNKNGGYYNPLALYALIPSSNNRTAFYQNKNYDIRSNTPALPSIGSVVIDFENECLDLSGILKKILQLI